LKGVILKQQPPLGEPWTASGLENKMKNSQNITYDYCCSTCSFFYD
jgi:hypothetical protein